LLELARFSLYLFIGILVIQAVISWVSPYTPLAPLFNALANPVLRPFRRYIPPIGNVDLSPLAAIVLAQVLLIALEYFMRVVGALL
jgi:YggT family protein